MGLFSRGEKVEPDELPTVPLFVGLDDDEIASVAAMAERRELSAGDKLIEQGRYGDSFFIVASGRALVYIADQYITAVGEGSAIGEMSLLERRPRNATVVAEGDMVVAEFSIKDFRKLLEKYPSARLRIHELLNRRLAENIAAEPEAE
jgi:CRP-like cAMP-binding protein